MPMPAKDRFLNESGATLGVSVHQPGGQGGFRGIPVYPGEVIDLDKDEQAVTANAPRDPRSNPLANGSLRCIADGLEYAERRPLRFDPDIATNDPARPPAVHITEDAEVGTAIESMPVARTEGEFGVHEEQGEIVTGREHTRAAPKAAPGQLQGTTTPRPKTTST